MKNKRSQKKISEYTWLSLLFLLFFWIPILNVIFFLPASMYFGTKAINRSRKDPDKYKGTGIAVFSTSFALLSFVYGLYILSVSLNNSV